MAERPWRAAHVQDSAGGADTGYWETLWAEEKAQTVPLLVDVLGRELEGRRRVLESGCGTAGYLRALAEPGRTVIGVDLARRALAEARHDDPDLPLAVADVGALPHPDGAFDAVLSLGVVEHDPTGPAELLAEHRRILAPGGRLLLTVPQRSWWRAATDCWHLGIRRRRAYRQGGRVITAGPASPEGTTFHQYEPSRRQLLGALRHAGFRIVRWEALDVGSGLRDLRDLRSRTPGPAPTAPAPSEVPPASGAAPRGLRGVLRHLTVSTDEGGAVATRSRRLVARALGHIQLVVAEPAEVSG